MLSTFTIISIVTFLLILSLLVFVHELGHFVVAKWSGITVEEFAIGFPPRAFKFWQDEGQITLQGQEYIIGRKVNLPHRLQIGSRVEVQTGLDDQGRSVITQLELVETDDSTDETDLTTNPFAKALANQPGVTVEALTKPTEYSVNWVPLGGYVRMLGEEDPSAPGSFASKSKRIRLAVLVAGSAMNLITAIFFFTLTSMSGVPEPPTTIDESGQEVIIAETVIETIVPGTPADSAGLQSEDIIVGANGSQFNHTGDLVDYVEQHKGEEITLVIRRGEELLNIPLVPRRNPPPGEGSIGIGLRYNLDTEVVYYPPHEAVVKGVEQTAKYVGLVFYVPYAIFNETIPAEVIRPTGPVGIYKETGNAINATLTLDTWYPILSITAILSAALAITNLLPLPALDGGRILFIFIEALRGKRVSPEKEGLIHLIGLGMLLTLMVVITIYDVRDPIPSIPWENLFD